MVTVATEHRTIGITIADIRKALMGGGDVSQFVPAVQRALGNAPVTSVSSLEVPAALPEATALLQYSDKDLSSLVEMWLRGERYQGALVNEVELKIVGVAPYGRNIGRYLEKVLDEVKPDTVALDVSPMGLSANMLYAFGMPGAAGMPVYGEVLDSEGRQLHTVEFYPGSMSQTAIISCWRAGVPVVPVGMPAVPKRTPGMAMGASIEKEIRKSNLLAAYHNFDDSLGKVPGYRRGSGIARRICASLSKIISGESSEKMMEEAGYTASRVLEVASFVHSLGRSARILSVVDMKHYIDMEYAIGYLTRGITDEVYQPTRRDMPVAAMTSKYSARLEEYTREHTPTTTLAQELFRSELEKLSQAKGDEPLSESEADELIAAITSRTRAHPAVKRGASVRGAIAFKEVLQSYQALRNGLTRSSTEKAAMITLPFRIMTKQGDYESAQDIIGEIAKEVLYGIHFSRTASKSKSLGDMGGLSAEDIMAGLQNLDATQTSQGQGSAQNMQIAIIPDKDRQTGTDAGGLSQSQHASVRKAIEHLLEKLEQQLESGEITEEEYNREKRRLEQMLGSASKPQFPMSDKELSETVMELMDAQDKQWQKDTSFEQMYIYYHIKSMGEGKELSPPKRDYYGLRLLIDDLEKRGIIRATKPEGGFALTPMSLDAVLEFLAPKAQKGKELESMLASGKTQVRERKHDIRRYSVGDVFRDISVRHTLREVAKQKKRLSDINRRDFRVFMKPRRRLQSDIVLCMDTSSSMGYRHKLAYARLAAAGLAKAALERGDRFGIVTFDNFGRAIMPLTSQKETIFNYIVGMSAGGNTNIGDGIKCATQLLVREPSHNQKYTVLITDGEPTAITEKAFARFQPTKERDLTAEYALLETRKAAFKGIVTSVIHITNGKGGGSKLAKDIARVGKGQVRKISSLGDIREMIK